MKRILLTMLGALAIAGSAKAITADEAAMAALYPEHETFFENELYPIERPVHPPQKTSIISVDWLVIMHVSELGQ